MTIFTPVSSSNIDAVAYEPHTQTMRVAFSSGKTYEYQGIAPEQHQALIEAAPSHAGTVTLADFGRFTARNKSTGLSANHAATDRERAATTCDACSSPVSYALCISAIDVTCVASVASSISWAA